MLTDLKHEFNAGEISSDAGAYSIYSFVEKVGLPTKLEKCFPTIVNKFGPKIQYTKAQKIQNLITGYMTGYPTYSIHCRTSGDSVIETFTQTTIPSQPTMSKVITSFAKEDLKQIRELNFQIVEQYYKEKVRQNNGQKLEVITFGTDSTKIETYGKQEGGELIHHYKTKGYHPDLALAETERIILDGVLRKGSTYCSDESELIIKKVVELLGKYTKRILFTGDSGLAKPAVIEELNKNRGVKVEWILKAKTYSSWIRKCNIVVQFNGEEYTIEQLPREFFEETNVKGKIVLVKKYFSFYHKAESWKKKEKIVLQVTYKPEPEQQELFESAKKDYQMLITNTNLSGKEAFKKYAKRGIHEQIIEEFKNDMFGANLSSSTQLANSCLFQLKILAYNLMQILKMETFHDTKYANCRISTMRTLIAKIGGKIVKHARKLVLKLSSSFAYQDIYNTVMRRILRTQFHL